MFYSRLSHRHIAIASLYFLLTIGVLGLLVILCIFNATEHNYLFDSAFTTSDVKLAKYGNGQESVHRTTHRKPSTYNGLENDSSNDEQEQDGDIVEEQQHIYIDELYTEKTAIKPKRVSHNYIRKTQNFSEYSTDQMDNESGKKVFNLGEFHFDDDTDNDNEFKNFYRNKLYYDNENVASGSGDRLQFNDQYNTKRNTHNGNTNGNQNPNEKFDLETQKFIKRIGIKLLQLSKRNLSDHSLASKSLTSTNRKKKRKTKKLFGSRTVVSKINYYRSLDILHPTSYTLQKVPDFPKLSQKTGYFPFWPATYKKNRRIIGNEKKSAERSRQLLLCEQGKSGGGADGDDGGRGVVAGGGAGGELCRMLFKET